MSFEKDRQYKKDWVDSDTQRLILQGFAFDGSTFPLDESSRNDYTGMKTLEGAIVWPVVLPTLAGGYYTLTDANLNGFLGAGLLVYRGYRESGRLLKDQLDAATNETELNDIDLSRS